MDMISNLSDDLLLKILSDLPTKDVVATMFLSKRWKFLWTMVSKLDFDDGAGGEYLSEDCLRYRVFQEYVDRFLVLHKSPVLETLKLNLGCWLSTTDDMSTWIRIAIARRVRELEIDRCPKLEFSVRLPGCLYTFEKLVVLKLCRSITLDVPMEVCLSSLKSLHLLNVEYKNEKSFGKLLSGCPVLEELVLDITYTNSVPSIYVIMPSLQRLSILDQYHVYGEKYIFNEKVVINVPSLKYLDYVDIYDYGQNLCSSENMPELVEANVKLVCESPEKLMRSLTSVKRLSLCLYGSMLQHCIEFYQLVHLELCGCGPNWWKLLTWMLESSPKLHVLKLDKERYDYSIVSIKGSWGQPSSVPKCLQFHLNTFEWNSYNGRREETKVVAYILKNARCLKTAVFSDLEFGSKKKATRKLKALVSLPRASSSCQASFRLLKNLY